jgi:pSer/pThr/pTyr-binding forkhead associated (FHA) protein/ABC-type sulfate/molybdate transport systems ATPase subunit
MFIRQTQLVVTWPNGTEQKIPLTKDVTHIGRGAEGNDIQVPILFKSVSRRHLEIRREGSGFRAVDLESANGVTLNGRPISDSPITDGDELRIGEAAGREEIRITLQVGSELELQAQGGPIATLAHFLKDPPSRAPHLRVRWPDGRVDFFPLTKNIVLIGRSEQADLRLPESMPFVSKRHAEIRYTPGKAILSDLNSTNGTFLNSKRLEPGTPVILPSGSVIRIGDEGLGISIGLTFFDPADAGSGTEGYRAVGGAPTQMTDMRQLVIGRSSSCDIVLDGSAVSRMHARVQQVGDQFGLEDMGSLNGTYLNGGRVTSVVRLGEGDVIEIGGFALMFRNGELLPYKSKGVRLDVTGLTKTLPRKQGGQLLLDDISLTVLPGEFVAVVGGSGSGRAPLVSALLGVQRAEGEVRLDGRDLYRDYDALRTQLGYVPQSDILHASLTVENALDYAARLRLPLDLSFTERWERIAAALDTVSMNVEAVKKSRIRDLSVWQRKCVSIAAELLADPRLIYLDNVTAGLDPGMESRMMHTLRHMADQGRTVVLVTQATNNIVQADHVAFLSQGKLVYFGPPRDALEFFSVNEFADIYERIESRGEQWRHVFEEEKPANYERYVLNRQKERSLHHVAGVSRASFGLEELARQLVVLAQRSLKVLTSEPATLALLFLLFPVAALLQVVTSSPYILTGDPAILPDPLEAAKTMTASYRPFPPLNTFIVIMGLEALLVGVYFPTSELIRERTIYLRERLFSLRVLPYLMSKVVIYTILAGLQTALYLLVLSLGVDLPARGLLLPGWMELFITLFLTLLVGTSIGLVVSAASRSTGMAMSLLVILIFFQVFFAGAVFDLRTSAARPLSYLTAARWALTAVGVTIDIPRIAQSTILCRAQPDDPLTPEVEQTPCFHYPEAAQDLWLDYSPIMLLVSWVMLMVMWLFFTALAAALIKRLDRAGL